MHKHERDPAHHLLANLPWHLLPWLGLTGEPWMSQWCSFPAVQRLGLPCPALLREQRVAGLGQTWGGSASSSQGPWGAGVPRAVTCSLFLATGTTSRVGLQTAGGRSRKSPINALIPMLCHFRYRCSFG